ncbi:MAG: hypothetical protein ACLUG4_05350 [Bacilli bacterium]
MGWSLQKNGQYLEGRYKGYHKNNNCLEYYINGLDTLSRTVQYLLVIQELLFTQQIF